MSKFFHYDHESGKVVEGRAPVRETMAAWPMQPCVASGVNASQGEELRKFFSGHGESVVVVDGDPVYESPSQRKKLLKLRGFVDRSSYC